MKRIEIGSDKLERKLFVLALSETMVKGKGECIFESVVVRMSGVVNGYSREVVALLLNKRVLEGVVEYRKVLARLIWVKAKFVGKFWVLVSAYDP